MTKKERELLVQRSRETIKRADRVSREIERTLREAERNTEARRERLRRAGIFL